MAVTWDSGSQEPVCADEEEERTEEGEENAGGIVKWKRSFFFIILSFILLLFLPHQERFPLLCLSPSSGPEDCRPGVQCVTSS